MATNTELAVGIDLGTTFSAVAFLDVDGRPVTVRNAEGDLITPSVVFLDSTGVVVGKEAVNAAHCEPHRVARFMKRDMGESTFGKSLRGEMLPPEVLQAAVLQKLKADAELQLGEIRQAVITVPAYFNEPCRKATMDAGRLAGIEVLDIINEPTAAAICYGVQQGFLNRDGASSQRERVLIYDLGGGTFDVTVMDIEGTKYRALATGGDVYLGGADWDQRLVDYLACEFQKQFGTDPRQDPISAEELLQRAIETKHALTARNEMSVFVAHNGQRARYTVTRAKVEELTGELLDRTLLTVRKVLADAASAVERRETRRAERERQRTTHDVFDGSDSVLGDDVPVGSAVMNAGSALAESTPFAITRLLLVGGSTRMPMVQQMLEQETGLTADRSLSPDEAIAHGAALFAGLLLKNGAERLQGISLTNVNSHDLGVLGIEQDTGRPRRSLMIPANSPLPASATKVYTLHREGQTSVKIDVIEGGDHSGNNSTAIGRCSIQGLPSGLPAKTPVAVTFQYARNGRLTVKARLTTIGRDAELVITRAAGLPAEDFDRWQRRLNEGLSDAAVPTQPSKVASPPIAVPVAKPVAAVAHSVTAVAMPVAVAATAVPVAAVVANPVTSAATAGVATPIVALLAVAAPVAATSTGERPVDFFPSVDLDAGRIHHAASTDENPLDFFSAFEDSPKLEPVPEQPAPEASHTDVAQIVADDDEPDAPADPPTESSGDDDWNAMVDNLFG